MTILLQCVHNNACNKPLQMYLLPNKMYSYKLAWCEYTVSFINSWLFYSQCGGLQRILISCLKHLITKQDTKMRLAIPPRERMSLTLRFLATGWCDCMSKLNDIYVFLIIVNFNVCLCMFCNFSGESFKSLRFQYRVGTSTISQMVVETCAALYQVLKEDFLKVL